MQDYFLLFSFFIPLLVLKIVLQSFLSKEEKVEESRQKLNLIILLPVTICWTEEGLWTGTLELHGISLFRAKKKNEL